MKKKSVTKGSDTIFDITGMPTVTLPWDSYEAARIALDTWHEDRIALVESKSSFALSNELETLIERTNYLAHWCESLNLDSSPLLQFARELRETYFNLRPTLPPVSSSVWITMDRLKFRLNPISAKSVITKRLTKDEANRLAKRFLKNNPHPKIQEVVKAIGVPQSSVAGLPAWRDEMKRRDSSKAARKVKTRSLPDKMLAVVEGKDDGGHGGEDAAEVWLTIMDAASPEIREQLVKKSGEERQGMVDAYYKANYHRS